MRTIPPNPAVSSPSNPQRTASRALARIGTVPHRLFFLTAMVLVALIALAWLWVIVARTGVLAQPPLAIAQPVWHALAMLFGFLPFYMFGFLFTAGPKWLAVEPPPIRVWRTGGLVAAAGVLTMLFAPSWMLAQLGAGVFGLAWLAFDAVFAGLILASPARDRVHATLVLCAMLAGASGPLAFALFGSAAYSWLVFAGVWLFAVPMFVVVCHRMIPFFTAGVLPATAMFRPWWLLAVLVTGPVAHAMLDAAGYQRWTWLVDAPLALVAFDLARRWGLAQSLANRLLAMLHLGFVWYAIAFALFAAASLFALGGLPGALGAAPVHALTIGFSGSLMLAMVSRVTYGHSGRTLAADRVTWSLFLLLQATVVVRIVSALWPLPALLVLTAALWAASVVPWAARNLPIYWRARADGRPG